MTRVLAVVLSALMILSVVAGTAAVGASGPPGAAAEAAPSGAAPASIPAESRAAAGRPVPGTGSSAAAQEGESPPVAVFSVDPSTPTVGETVTLDASESFDPDGEIAEYVWTVDGERIGTGETVEYTIERRSGSIGGPPPPPRPLSVSLRVVDDDDESSSYSRLILVDRTPDDDEDEEAEERGNKRPEIAPPEPVEGFETEKGPRGFEIPFLSGSVLLEEGLDPEVVDTDREFVWAVVQFRSTPSGETLDRLEELGYRQRAVLTDTAFYAGVPRANADALAGLESVRAVASVEPDWKVPPRLAERVEETDTGERFRVAVRTFESIEGRAAELELERVRERTYRGRLTAEQVRALQENPAVRWIEPYNSAGIDLAEGRRMVAAQPPTFSGVDGTGVRVGVVDTGIDHNHPHFSGVTVVDSFDELDNDYFPEADAFGSPSFNRHGTHVAGTIAGSSTVGGRPVTGIAQNATLVIARGLGEDQFDRVNNNGTDIISNSWSGGTGGQYASRVAFTDRWARNHPQTLLVVSYGNYNSSIPAEQFAGAPSIAKNTLTVGSLLDGSRFNGRLSSSSVDRVNNIASLNNLSQPKDGRQKPDVNAPGQWITSSIPNGTYVQLRGSSMATPHVSGIAALYEDEYSGRNPDANEIKAAIVATAAPVENPKPSERPEGYGAADAHNAVYNNSYESRDFLFRGELKPPIPTANKHTFRVANDAEKVVVSLSWLDPPGAPSTTDTLVNDLDLYVGPASDPKRYSVTDRDQSVNRVVVDSLSASETGTNWVVTVEPHNMWIGLASKPRQAYDGNVRVVTEEPGLSVTVPDEVIVKPRPSASTSFPVTVEGTGAPVHGISAVVDSDARLSDCRGSKATPSAFVIGTRSGDFSSSWSRSLCFQVPAEAGTYPVTVTVNSTNAGRTTIRKQVDVVVPEPRVELEPFERNVTVGENATYRLVARNLSGGVGAYEVAISFDRPSIGEFTAFTVEGRPTSDSVRIAPDSDTVIASGGGMDTSNNYGTATIGILEAQGETVGKSNISVEVARLRNESGDGYPLRPQGTTFNSGIPSDGLLNVTRGFSEPEVTLPPDEDDGDDSSVVEVDDPVVVGIDPGAFDVAVTEVSWQFGDGATASGRTVEHTYEEAGNYTVVAEVLLADGRTEEVSRRLTVQSGSLEGPVVRLAPAETTVGPNETRTLDIVLAGIDSGVSAYDVEVAVGNTSTAAITAVADATGGSASPDVASDGSSAGVSTVGADVSGSGPVTLATVTVEGRAAGTTGLNLTSEGIGDADNRPYTLAAVRDATLQVREEVGPPPVCPGGSAPTDPDADGTFEDANGDGTFDIFDVQCLLDNFDSDAVQNNPSAFDFTGDDKVDIFDVQAGLNAV